MRKVFLLVLAGAVAVAPTTTAMAPASSDCPARQPSPEKHRARDGRGRSGSRTAAALTSKIKAKMALDDLVNAADINVDTDGSAVTLTGKVGLKRRAAASGADRGGDGRRHQGGQSPARSLSCEERVSPLNP